MFVGLELEEEPETESTDAATTKTPALLQSPPTVESPRSVVDAPSFDEVSSLDWSPAAVVVPMSEDDDADPIELARKRANRGDRRVQFAAETQVTMFQALPSHEAAHLFWSEMEGYELRNERRRLLQSFKWHLSYAGSLVPWSEDQGSMYVN